MRPHDVDWRSGSVVQWDLGFLDPRTPILEQVDHLNEDLAQIHFGERVLDVGWYPEFSAEGAFVVTVAWASNWEEPLFVESCTTLEALLSCLERAVMVAHRRIDF